MDARKWIISGGGGHEDGEDGIRARTVSMNHAIELMDEFAEYRLESQWIKITDDPETLPEYERHVWVVSKGRVYEADFCEGFDRDHDHFDTACYSAKDDELLVIPRQKASHWQYFVIPTPPEVSK